MRDRVAWTVTAVGAVGFVLLAWWLLPWNSAPDVSDVVATQYFSPAHLQEAEAYSRRARLWSWSSLAVSLAWLVACACLRPFRRWLGRLRGPWWWTCVVAVVLVLAGQRLLTLPLGWMAWRNRVEYGISTQGAGGWLRDVAVAWGTSTAVMALVVLLVVGMRRRWPRWWTAIAGTVAAAAVVLGSWVYPVLVEPLSHDFEPLAEGELRDDITSLAARSGVEVDEVLVADASRRTTALNAWVSGFGSTRRVVLYDTLLEGVPREEVLAVVAHELAHAKYHDVVLGTALGAFGAFAGVGLLGVVLSGRSDPVSRRPAAVVPCLLLLTALGLQVTAPVQNGISRQLERRADAQALEWVGDPAPLVRLQVSLAERSLSDPTPPRWSQFMWGSHPTTLERIVAAEE